MKKVHKKHKVKYFILAGILFILLLLAVLIMIPRKTTMLSEQEQTMIRQVELSDEIGQAYLDSKYSDYTYDDEYLKYVYPGESLGCPLPEQCNITYRLLDAYFDVYLLEQVADVTRIQDQVEDAHAVLSALAGQWETETIYNTIKSEGNGIALDTYCILAFLEENKKMTQVVKEHLSNNHWLADDYYQQDIWRNVADESWCARLLISMDDDKETTMSVVYKLVDDTDTFMYDEEISDTDKLSVVYHMLYVVTDWEKKYADGKFTEEKNRYSDFISYFSYKNLLEDNLMKSNLLDVMVYSEYDNPEAMEELAVKVIQVQQPDGHWRMNAAAGDNFVQVFTTFRALIGLNQYRNYLLEK